MNKDTILQRFKCQQSGNCCKCPGVVYVTPADIQGMAKTLKMSEIEFRHEFVIKQNGWDVISTTTHRPNCFLDENNRCQVYEHRPTACRTYPDWDVIWESEATLEKECQLCPGLKAAVKISKTTFKS